MRHLAEYQPRTILVRSTNWVGDAIMTTPAVRTIRANFPGAKISILAYPWVADIFAASPHVDEVLIYQKKGRHQGLHGLWQLGRELRERCFDMAILLQNAFEAALLANLAGIPVRAGYRRDGRGLLLTHGVTIRPEVRRLHQVHYYQGLLAELGLSLGPDELFLQLPTETSRWAREFLASRRPRRVVGLNPGAAYGPAKKWAAERYAGLAARLHREYGATLLVFGTAADQEAAALIKAEAPEQVVDLSGKTTLAEAMALIGCCDAFVTNDSGLMHVAAAQKVPLVAIFGSTDEVATGPFCHTAVILKKALPCSPCFKTHCRFGHYQCMAGIEVDEVFVAVAGLLEAKGEEVGHAAGGLS
ncbi:MAG: lipopolysaccharide heptosyltransferase II [Thermodesulfobacteriota bacterium]